MTDLTQINSIQIIPASGIPELGYDNYEDKFNSNYGKLLEVLDSHQIISIEQISPYSIEIKLTDDILIAIIRDSVIISLANEPNFIMMSLPDKLFQLLQNGILLDFDK